MSDHPSAECDENRAALEAVTGRQLVCQSHEQNEEPVLLVGGICPICQPNMKVKFVDPLHVSSNIEFFHINPLYEIHNQILCNYSSNIQCHNIQCKCKDKRFLKNERFWGHWKTACKDFWDDYLLNLGGFPHDVARLSTHEGQSPDASPSENDDGADDGTSQSEQNLVTEQTMPEADVFAFEIRNPETTVKPHDFLWDKIDEILNAMLTSNLLCGRHDDNFKLWIWAHTHYKRSETHVKKEREDEKTVRFHNTYNYYVPGANGGIQKHILERAIADLDTRVDTVITDMSRSGWVYHYATNIKIVMLSVQGKKIQ